ncbi:hypothetical protein, partial [Telmatospirillum sp.]|uniref:hypothetical protein n=1 Tax=Telmatospirillum sp. TaxID=2079197 RepID=UPI00284DE18D
RRDRFVRSRQDQGQTLRIVAAVLHPDRRYKTAGSEFAAPPGSCGPSAKKCSGFFLVTTAQSVLTRC